MCVPSSHTNHDSKHWNTRLCVRFCRSPHIYTISGNYSYIMCLAGAFQKFKNNTAPEACVFWVIPQPMLPKHWEEKGMACSWSPLHIFCYFRKLECASPAMLLVLEFQKTPYSRIHVCCDTFSQTQYQKVPSGGCMCLFLLLFAYALLLSRIYTSPALCSSLWDSKSCQSQKIYAASSCPTDDIEVIFASGLCVRLRGSRELLLLIISKIRLLTMLVGVKARF
jgi:hypothetical protein